MALVMEVKFLILAAIIFEVAVSVPVKSKVASAKQNDIHVGVYGGKNITITKARYVAALMYKSNSSVFGAGAILNNRWILTTAFIFDNKQKEDVFIKVGSTKLNKNGKKVQIQNLYIHPRFQGVWDYDIALMKLTKPLKFSKSIGPIARANLPKNGTVGQFAGYGETQDNLGGFLKQVSIPVADYDFCKPFVDSTSFTDLSFCTMVDDLGPCYEDYGGPFVYDNKLVGLYSSGFGCGKAFAPSIYSTVGKYDAWIDQVIKSNGKILEEDEDHFENEE